MPHEVRGRHLIPHEVRGHHLIPLIEVSGWLIVCTLNTFSWLLVCFWVIISGRDGRGGGRYQLFHPALKCIEWA